MLLAETVHLCRVGNVLSQVSLRTEHPDGSGSAGGANREQQPIDPRHEERAAGPGAVATRPRSA
jgi:hypothetical protein